MSKKFFAICLSIAAVSILNGAEELNYHLRNQEYQLWDKIAAVPHSIPADAKLSPVILPSKDKYTRIKGHTSPSVIYFPANSGKTKPAIVVCPGGGHSYLSIETEGYYICNYLNHLGYSAFLLKYRTMGRKRTECAFSDAARAIRFIRKNSEKFSIDPDRIGVIGFSAGGHVAAFVSAPAKEPYPAADDIDKLSFRPNFSMLIYPAYLAEKDLTIHPEFKIDSTLPPTFIVQTQDDFVGVENGVAWYLAAKNAGVKTEMHLFPKGKHGYGVKKGSLAVNQWPVMLEKWLENLN